MNSSVEAPTNVSLWNMQYPTPGMQFHSAHSQKDAAQQQISVKLARTVCAFTSALSSTGTGTLSQIWLPSVCEDGSVVLSTQGVPFSVSGTVDLLALFRCISCRFKFTTDVTKPSQMGVVGRVFASGEPEFSHNVQTYNKSVYLRVSDAQRCRVHSTMLLPLYLTAQREHPFGVFEVCQTETNVLFPSLVDLLQRCLEDVHLFTVDIEKHSMGMGLRSWPTNVDYNSKDSASVVTYGQDAPACNDLETHCSADSIQHTKPVGSAADGQRLALEPSRAAPAAVKTEKIADSEDVGGGSAGQAPRQPALQPSGSSAQALMQARQRQADARDIARYPSGGHPPFPPGVVKPEGTARLKNVGNRLVLDLEPLLPNLATAQRSVSLDLGRQGSGPQARERSQPRMDPAGLQHRDMLHRNGLSAALPAAPALHAAHPNPVSAPLQDMACGSGGAGLESMPWGPGSASDGLAFCDEDEDDGRSALDSAGQDGINNRVGGGAGKRLSLQDLQAQFGVGLREAAANLRICPTTLKRACRRHGITRWPRRQLAKLGNRSDGSSRSDPSGGQQQQQQQQPKAEWASASAPSSRPGLPTSISMPPDQHGLGRGEGGMTTRAAVAAVRTGRASTSPPTALAALEIPPELQCQQAWGAASAGILDMFNSMSPTAASVPPPHTAPLMHPNDMLW